PATPRPPGPPCIPSSNSPGGTSSQYPGPPFVSGSRCPPSTPSHPAEFGFPSQDSLRAEAPPAERRHVFSSLRRRALPVPGPLHNPAALHRKLNPNSDLGRVPQEHAHLLRQ